MEECEGSNCVQRTGGVDGICTLVICKNGRFHLIPHRMQWNLMTCSCREGYPSQGAPGKLAMPWLGNLTQGQMSLKKENKTQPKFHGLEEESREVPSAVEIALSASVSSWLACWL